MVWRAVAARCGPSEVEKCLTPRSTAQHGQICYAGQMKHSRIDGYTTLYIVHVYYIREHDKLQLHDNVPFLC